MKLRLILPLLFAALSVAASAQTTTPLNYEGNCGPSGANAIPGYTCFANGKSIFIFINNGTGTLTFWTGDPFGYGGNTQTGSATLSNLVNTFTTKGHGVITATYSGTNNGLPVSGTITLPFYEEYLSGGGRGAHYVLTTIGTGGDITQN